ncbi:SDR family oxidoreductase [Enterobacter cloacae]|uniref:SDR family oxidoreductase n=1 Tax=Enterobacter cloacae TaxID=550 RepID=A0AAW6NUU9_ENTCL|nr:MULTISPECIES: SDR family oxidoreductase [Enterobacter]AIV29567.1 NAD-dependent dehydratase [Enterobacter cloacae]AOE95375.1 NAD-dependent dehydratase [Enterobacter cloacae]ELV2842586.1 SDR family oxidoreductase [Enterobacter cloacae]EMB9073231.1 SDR family oxidoreductase [Enterobacter cloacae]KVJ43292.1 NAD-dependent dehydratase [Enterobacter cloacae subsp. cloacae]
MNTTQQHRVALVAGASGIVGNQLVKTLLRHQWEVIGLSRQAVSHPEGIAMVNVDLLDAQDSARALSSLSGITHVFYSAWVNAANWTEMVEPNVTMLRHLVSNLENTAPLETVSLMQGYKVYGAHLGPFKTPARESDPGVPGAEFNAAQLRWLSDFQRGKAWHWSAIRPGVVGSTVPGNAMNLALSIALYASLCKALNLPLRFPGAEQTWHSIVDHTDGELLAEATVWAATSPVAENQAFNVNNGDIWRWSELWPRIAHWFGLEFAPPVRLSFQQLFTDYRTVWHELAAARGLVESDILQLNDGQFADFVFGWDYDMFGDGSKLRRAGFTSMRATDEMFFSLFAQLRAARIIP